MDKLVFLENDQPLTSSRIVAEKFEKLHKNVVQAIENIKAENSALTPCYYAIWTKNALKIDVYRLVYK